MKATTELAGKQDFHSWLILFYSTRLQSNSGQKLTCAEFPRPCNHLVILMFLSAFMTTVKMTILLRSHRKQWLLGSSSTRLTKVWSSGSSLHPYPLRQTIRNPGTFHLAPCSRPGRRSHHGQYEWNIWGSTKWHFYMKVFSQLCYQKPLQLKTKPNTKKTWRQGKHIFEQLGFSPKHFNTHEWKPSNSTTGDTFLESKGSGKLSTHPRKTKAVRIKWTS